MNFFCQTYFINKSHTFKPETNKHKQFELHLTNTIQLTLIFQLLTRHCIATLHPTIAPTHKHKHTYMAGCIVPEYNLSTNSGKEAEAPKQKKIIISEQSVPSDARCAYLPFLVCCGSLFGCSAAAIASSSL